MSLKKQALSSIFWTTLQQFSNQGIAFIVSLILARLLMPAEFGLIAMISVFMAVGRTLIDSGLNQSLIRSSNITQEDLDTVFLFNLIVVKIVCIRVVCKLFYQKITHAPIDKILEFWNATVF